MVYSLDQSNASDVDVETSVIVFFLNSRPKQLVDALSLAAAALETPVSVCKAFVRYYACATLGAARFDALVICERSEVLQRRLDIVLARQADRDDLLAGLPEVVEWCEFLFSIEVLNAPHIDRQEPVECFEWLSVPVQCVEIFVAEGFKALLYM